MVFAEPIMAYKRTHMVTVLIKQFEKIMGKTPIEKLDQFFCFAKKKLRQVPKA